MSTQDLSDSAASLPILELFPQQGDWQEGDYFALPSNRLVELIRGHVEVLPMPSLLHQFLSRAMFILLHEFVEQHDLGIVMMAPTRVRIAERHFREPDVLFVRRANKHRHGAQYWETIDLAVEIVSPDDPDRDLVDKRRDYAAAGISEYWLIDPRDDTVQVLSLQNRDDKADAADSQDREYEVLDQGSQALARSVVLPDFLLDIAKLFRNARAM